MAAQDYEQVTYNGPSGAQIGQSSTEKVAFWGATPVVRRSGSAQAALTLTTVSATKGRGFNTSAAFNAMIAQVNEIRATLVAYGLWAGS